MLDDDCWRSVRADGLHVLSERIDTVRSVALGIWVRHGGAHDRDGEGGLAHLLEHMVFKGTKRRTPHEIALEVEQVGGSLDAYTSHEHTGFVARVPEEHLGLACDVLIDLVLDPLLRSEDLELERDVILEELSSLEDAPDQLAFELHGDRLYEGHPYGRSLLGTRDSVASFDTTALRRLHDSAYTAGNCVVAASGRVSHEELCEVMFGAMPHAPAPSSPVLPEVRANASGGRSTVERPGGRQSHIVAGGLTVPRAHPLRYALVLVETAIGAGMSSRLFQRIREELGLAYSVYSFHSFYEQSGHVGTYMGTRPEAAEAACEALFDELRALAEHGLGQDEVTQTKEQLKGQLMIGLESPASRMQRLAGLSLYREPYRTLDELAERVEGITMDEVAQAAAFFDPDRLTVLELRPV